MPAQTNGHTMTQTVKLAVLIPCYNEELTIAQVINDFAQALPEAVIYVGDNNSTDNTAKIAREAGAHVIREGLQGKGNVVRRLFADIDADIYLMIDGDATYEAAAARRLVNTMLDEGYDFLNGSRISEQEKAYRPGHRLGNRVLSGMVQLIFGSGFSDMLSGYKLFSRRFVKSFPVLSSGFEIETELTVHALELGMPCGEEPTLYGERPTGSVSKLRTFRDGFMILRLIVNLIRNERPLMFFCSLGLGSVLIALLLAQPIIMTYLDTGLVPRLPTAILATGFVITGLMSIMTGLILDSVTVSRRTSKHLAYISVPKIKS